MIKFKYIEFSLPIVYIMKGLKNYPIIDNPLKINQVPNETYMIRGDKKGQRKY